MRRKGQPRGLAEVFRRATRRKELPEHMQSGHDLPETDEHFAQLLRRLDVAEARQVKYPVPFQRSPG
ncbi:hypothetical protein CU100_24485 [Phyllobacterium endophyticum]|uniref:Uncharacterized protein n=1 Tax=Phyllobacterium endophyticum TaxID=1149773 RepID=A0A2P7AKM1_9HYPH|nr:hypothetical protein CU100_24485 [Phyllobacterium endophyticum]